jgi:hypothetical protein
MSPKLDLAVVAAVFAAGVLWVEHGHHLSTDAAGPPDPMERAAAAAGCANNDNAPYSASCLAFMGGDVPMQMRGWAISLPSVPAAKAWSSAECPASDNRPYPIGCIRYLSGWFWRPN